MYVFLYGRRDIYYLLCFKEKKECNKYIHVIHCAGKMSFKLSKFRKEFLFNSTVLLNGLIIPIYSGLLNFGITLGKI